MIGFKQVVRYMAIVVATLSVAVARADVFNMGPGVKSLEMVPVGDAGNVADIPAHSNNPNGQGAVSYNYNIGKYEVTAAQYAEFLNAVGGVDTYELYNPEMANTLYGCGITRNGGGIAGDPYSYSVASDFINRPVNYTAWADAARFVNWLQNHQPTGGQGLSTTEDGVYCLNGAMTDASLLTVRRKEGWKWAIATMDEWYKAAYYKGNGLNSGYWYYATCNDTPPGCEVNDSSGNNCNILGSSCPDGHCTKMVGTFCNSESPYGTFDQGGNVWEWDETLMPGGRGHSGGCFMSSVGDLDCRVYGGLPPLSEYGTLGFRVVSIPEPNSLTMMGGIVLTALLWRRRRQAGHMYQGQPLFVCRSQENR